MAIGKCRLTGATGTFAKSHLTPQAFTAPDISGAYFIEAGEGSIPKRTFTSWYDKGILTLKGEKFLAGMDDWGVKFLRQHKLVWSGWGDELALPQEHFIKVSDTHGVRQVVTGDSKKLRIFLLSILWRWAVSGLKAAKEVSIPVEHEYRLRDMILSGDSGCSGFYGITLTQMATRGSPHNMAPIRVEMPVEYPDQAAPVNYQVFRVYFDGLVVRYFVNEVDLDSFGGMLVGEGDSFSFPTIAAEASFQYENLFKGMYEVESSYSNIVDKLLRRNTPAS
ncbi:hypothetical protein [Pseudomonas sp. EA_35y_Pfl2_R5]|uniref:hypothetical protein n=1 Tax=Pseudomonas sp. EA_35y_Pfl2_R5 TaxID=3088690 RepID=UPI0030DCE3A1